MVPGEDWGRTPLEDVGPEVELVVRTTFQVVIGGGGGRLACHCAFTLVEFEQPDGVESAGPS